MAAPGMVAGAGLAGAVAGAVASLGEQRVRYLRKVYGLLAGACVVALAAGWVVLNVGATHAWKGAKGEVVQVPWAVSLMLGSDTLWYAAFGVLFLATMVASAVSKVRIINVGALYGVAGLMGLELAPMIFIANYYAGIGGTMTSSPVRDAGIMTLAVFVGITSYIFVARKDFSFLKATLSMGFWVIFAACILAVFVKSEIFSLAVASAGALLSAGFLLYVTSYIFRNSEMDDPVGDALAMLVQLRNLFMFLLRIFMSSKN